MNGVFKVGIISDTHGLLRPEAVEALAGVDHILHAGDVGNPEILERLREIAPLTAIRGNVDTIGSCAALPETEAVELAGVLFYLVHSIGWLDINPFDAGVAVVVSGHSHKAEIGSKQGVLYVNPGSAGPRRFKLPVSIARLEIRGVSIIPRILEMEVA
ncbi:metallophosphoesterase family protein [Granulicella tundricola]|uniref:Phosphoesterase n=1 Tax=Granulicella tundricola (strain ATCC BAA-1859 / DSM 23138 / MP5ACTX9) TaxID=1198114 RepID=E8WZF2_GRATM|nr:metallophosphoesterase family protein [Granulicella tundricola]ADW68840.1 phosphodiesterase, MJ0936 family [Granulicella tundricola MP5ACTX9]